MVENIAKKKNFLIGVTGSVATIKLAPILDILIQEDAYNLKVVITQKADFFVNNENYFSEKTYRDKGVEFFRDQDEGGSWKKKGDPVVHIELRKWADLLLIAPLSANTLAKLANGLSDNLLTCVFRAWDFTFKSGEGAEGKLAKPVILSPAMNTYMYENPFTKKHIATLKELNTIVLEAVSKELACGDRGVGALPSPEFICEQVKRELI